MKKVSLFLMNVLVCMNYSYSNDWSELHKVSESDFQWTGIAVSAENRIFVNYPTWKIPSPFKVAELVDGKEVAYPSQEDNDLFICVQSVVADDENNLWIVDAASPQQKGVVEDGPRLYKIDLSTNMIVRTYIFSRESYTENSYMNDIRIDAENQMGYLTDSNVGGIVVVDLETGETWRALDADCPAVLANLDGINFKSTGKSDNRVHSDGIELSANRKMLFFAALTGDILYQIPVSVLQDRTLSVMQRCEQVTVLNPKNVPTDGIILYDNKLYMGDLPDEGVREFDLATCTGRTLTWGKVIRWADSFAKGPDGYIYFTTSQINYPENQRIKYEMFRFKPE